MKFNKNVLQVGGTALLTSLFFLICNFFSGGSGVTIKSGPIDWPKATKLKNEYEKSNQAMKVKFDKDGKTHKDVLKGLVFETKHLDDLINHTSTGIRPDSIIIYFGREGSFYDFPKWYSNLHIIAVGIKDGKILESDVYDKADPCPPYCPDN
jgi:hypothetical protein